MPAPCCIDSIICCTTLALSRVERKFADSEREKRHYSYASITPFCLLPISYSISWKSSVNPFESNRNLIPPSTMPESAPPPSPPKPTTPSYSSNDKDENHGSSSSSTHVNDNDYLHTNALTTKVPQLSPPPLPVGITSSPPALSVPSLSIPNTPMGYTESQRRLLTHPTPPIPPPTTTTLHPTVEDGPTIALLDSAPVPKRYH